MEAIIRCVLHCSVWVDFYSAIGWVRDYRVWSQASGIIGINVVVNDGNVYRCLKGRGTEIINCDTRSNERHKIK